MLNTNLELKPLSDETIERLRAVANDPIDAMRLAADVYATNAYVAERTIAIEVGFARPKPPKLQSTYLRSLAIGIKAKLADITELLTTEELHRLRALGGAVEKRLESDEGDLVEILVLLFAMEPADAALWIRAHLDDIETRFAS
jgi:hypothetical protein